MASTYPRFGYNNLLELAIDTNSENSSYPIERLINQRITSKYYGGWATDPIYINCYPVEDQLLSNWYFSEWSLGVNASPDGWTVTGSPLEDKQTNTSHVGSYGHYLKRDTADAVSTQEVACPASALGKQVSAGIWVDASTTGICKISVSDGTTTWTSAANTTTNYEWISITSGAIASNCTTLTVKYFVQGSTLYVGRFDGALLTVGATATQTPHAQDVDYMAMANHNLYSAGLKVTLEKSVDNFTTPVTVQAVTPAEDGTFFESFTSTSSAYLRLKIEATGTYFQRPEIGIANIGEMLEMPEYINTGWNPLKEKTLVKSAANFSGVKLGVDVRSTERKLQVVTKWLERSFLTGSDWQAFMDWAIRLRKPFFFAHNEGLYPLESYYVNVADSYEFSAPMKPRSLVEQVDLMLEGVRI